MRGNAGVHTCAISSSSAALLSGERGGGGGTLLELGVFLLVGFTLSVASSRYFTSDSNSPCFTVHCDIAL